VSFIFPFFLSPFLREDIFVSGYNRMCISTMFSVAYTQFYMIWIQRIKSFLFYTQYSCFT
jgi:hypothetical protein